MASAYPYDDVRNDLQNLKDTRDSPPPQYIQAQPTAPPTVVMAAAPAPVTVNAHSGFGAIQMPVAVGPESLEMNCPHCRCRIKTNVRHRSTAKTHISCVLLSWTLCCCCLPYCMDSCRNANHFCPMCGSYIGTYAS